jgi:hypothetical protein
MTRGRAGRLLILPAILSAALLLPCCSWSAGDRVLFASYAAFSAIDAAQTSMIKEYGLREGNPILANEDGSPDMTRVLILKTVGTGLIFWLLDSTRDGRREFLAAANGIQGGVVVWNEYWFKRRQGARDMAFARRETVYYCPPWMALGLMDPAAMAGCERASVAALHISIE